MLVHLYNCFQHIFLLQTMKNTSCKKLLIDRSKSKKVGTLKDISLFGNFTFPIEGEFEGGLLLRSLAGIGATVSKTKAQVSQLSGRLIPVAGATGAITSEDQPAPEPVLCPSSLPATDRESYAVRFIQHGPDQPAVVSLCPIEIDSYSSQRPEMGYAIKHGPGKRTVFSQAQKDIMIEFYNRQAVNRIRAEPRDVIRAMEQAGLEVLTATQIKSWWSTYHRKNKNLPTHLPSAAVPVSQPAVNMPIPVLPVAVPEASIPSASMPANVPPASVPTNTLPVSLLVGTIPSAPVSVSSPPVHVSASVPPAPVPVSIPPAPVPVSVPPAPVSVSVPPVHVSASVPPAPVSVSLPPVHVSASIQPAPVPVSIPPAPVPVNILPASVTSAVTSTSVVSSAVPTSVPLATVPATSGRLCATVHSQHPILEWAFPENFSQSTINGRNGSNACAFISLYFGQVAAKGLLSPRVGHVLPVEWQDALKEAILRGNDLHDELFDQEGIDLNAEDAVEMAGDDCGVLCLGQQKDLFGPSTKQLLAEWLNELSSRKERSCHLFCASRRTMLLMIDSSGDVYFVDSHSHKDTGALIATAPSGNGVAFADWMDSMMDFNWRSPFTIGSMIEVIYS